MNSTPKVAIVGAGPAGCTLAKLLIDASIPVTVFEGEDSPEARAQGGTLDLHADTGQKALKEAGLFVEFLKYARYDGEALAVVDKNLRAYIRMGGTGGESSSRGRPEIDRRSLRSLLVRSLPDGVIRWGHRLKSVDQSLSLRFDHGEERGFDLIVGADGAWSKIRPLLSPVQPHYAGLGGFDMAIERVQELHPHISKFVNRGSVFAFSDDKGFTLQQRGDDSMIVYIVRARDEEWMKQCKIDLRDAAQVKSFLLKEHDDWDELYKDAIRATDESQLMARSLYHLPVGHRWESKRGVTLIGDAAHVMTPFAGEGVNLAMADALSLANEIKRSCANGYDPKSLHEGVARFERAMFQRAEPMAKVSKSNMEDMFFTNGAPRTTIDSWVRRALTQDNWLLNILLPLWFVRTLLRWIFWW